MTGFLPGFFVAGQDKSKSGRFSKSGRIYTQPAKTSKKFSAAGGYTENCTENFWILIVE